MQKKILIVEDESSLRKAMTEKFQREGFDVLLASDGVEGLEQASMGHPDLILLDIIMPKMDGMTMFKKLRALDDWGKQVPVIILTNLASDDDGRISDVAELLPSYYLVKTDWKLADVVNKVKERLGE
jgi:two-component system response regulator VanR